MEEGITTLRGTSRLTDRIFTALGILVVALAILLSIGGVQVARGDEDLKSEAAPAPQSVDPSLLQKQAIERKARQEKRAARPLGPEAVGPGCEAPNPLVEGGEPNSTEQLLRLQQEMLRRAAAGQPGAGAVGTDEGIVLNNRGYGYGRPVGPAPQTAPPISTP